MTSVLPSTAGAASGKRAIHHRWRCRRGVRGRSTALAYSEGRASAGPRRSPMSLVLAPAAAVPFFGLAVPDPGCIPAVHVALIAGAARPAGRAAARGAASRPVGCSGGSAAPSSRRPWHPAFMTIEQLVSAIRSLPLPARLHVIELAAHDIAHDVADRTVVTDPGAGVPLIEHRGAAEPRGASAPSSATPQGTRQLAPAVMLSRLSGSLTSLIARGTAGLDEP